MKFLRLLVVSLSVGVLLTTPGYVSTVTAQDPPKESTNQTGEDSKTPTGFTTGTKCTKSGTYKAENKYMKVVVVIEEGEEFPPFTDGQPTTWYALTPSTKGTFEAVKATATDPK